MATAPASEKQESNIGPAARRLWRSISVPLVAVLLGLLIGALLLIASGANPIEAYGALLKGAIGTPAALQRTLEKAMPCGSFTSALAMTVLTGDSLTVAMLEPDSPDYLSPSLYVPDAPRARLERPPRTLG